MAAESPLGSTRSSFGSGSSTPVEVVLEANTSRAVFFSHDALDHEEFPLAFRLLHRHSKDDNFPVLRLFLASCSHQLREEIATLPQNLQRLIPHFAGIHALADFYKDLRHTPVVGAVENALLCAYEIASLIGHHEDRGLELDLPERSTILSGLGIGLLSAVAAATSTSLNEVASTGVECVRVAFRLGLRVEEMSQLLEPRGLDGNRASWAYVVTDQSLSDVQDAVKQQNEDAVSDPMMFGGAHATVANVEKSEGLGPAQICLSAIDRISTVVTGPPARLRAAFQNSELLRKSKHSPLPVYAGLCHAPHVYGAEDVAYVMEGCRSVSTLPRPVRRPLISSKNGRPFGSKDSGSLLEAVTTEIMTSTMHIKNICSGVLKSFEAKPLNEIMSFRSTIVTDGILGSIRAAVPGARVQSIQLHDWISQSLDGPQSGSTNQAKLAIVGMSCRLPGGADDLELFWDLMMDKRDVHTKIPADRFDIATHVDPTLRTPNTTNTPFGNFIQNAGLFDATFFNMSPKEAEQTDPMQRLALITAYEALEMSGFAPGRTPSTDLKRTGTFYGQASDDWREVNSSQNIGTYGLPGGERAFANGKIQYFFKFEGPSFNLDTACSSGLAAVERACSALWAGEADMAIAGGLNVITNPDIYCMLAQGHFLSKTGQCKVWDNSADGYCRADGVGSVVIKRLADAERDNDNIIAVVASGATNHSANSASITQPHVGAQMDNYRNVLHAAGVDPLDVSYVELHGTGTQVGDAVESESVARVFAPRNARKNDQRLHLGAVKSNIGHGEAAAGVTSLIKTLLTFQKSTIAPQLDMPTVINPVVAKNLEGRNAGMVFEPTPWVRPAGGKRYALVNSFGAHGGNTTLLLEDAPERTKTGQDPRKFHAVALSAKSKKSLEDNALALLEHLERNPQMKLADLAYTTTARRIHHNYRVASSVSSIDQLRKFLRSSGESADTMRPCPREAPAICFAFTGQGAFYNGMGSELFRDFPAFRSTVMNLDRIVTQLKFPSVLSTISGNSTSRDASPTLTQLSILVVEIALVRLLDLFGVRPSAVIGHSLGEYAALVAASVISAADAIFLVGKRTELLLKHCTMRSHAMLSVRADLKSIEQVAGSHPFEVSCLNGLGDTVVSGPAESIAQLKDTLVSNGLKAMLLDVPFAFHTSQMDAILDDFEKIASTVAFKAPSIPVISPTLSSCVSEGKAFNAAYLRRACREKVDFIGALDAARGSGVIDEKMLSVEIGPHPVCVNMIAKHLNTAKTTGTLKKDEDNWRTLTSNLAFLHLEGVAVCWNELFRPYESALSLLHLPAYRWNTKNYWIPYVGTWSLDKAFPAGRALPEPEEEVLVPFKPTSSIHQVLAEEISEGWASLVTRSDVMQPELRSAFAGHEMNGYAVASTTIWIDMGLTISDHLYRRLNPKHTGFIPMNFSKMAVQFAQVLEKKRTVPQYIQAEARIDMDARQTFVCWFNVDDFGTRAEDYFASATIHYEDSGVWEEDWERMAQLVSGRIDALAQSAGNSSVSRLSNTMVYNLFQNVVNYADHFRGMRSVVLSGFEAYADVVLDEDRHGDWFAPPHYTDPACHISGFIMNGSDAVNTRDFFYVTHGWEAWRAMEPLENGVPYKSYVKMVPVRDEAHMYAGDVYLLKDDRIVAEVKRMRFKRIPRQLMKNFFSPGQGLVKPQHRMHSPQPAAAPKKAIPSIPKVQVQPQPLKQQTFAVPRAELTPPLSRQHSPQPTRVPSPTLETPPPERRDSGVASSGTDDNSNVGKCMEIIAQEVGVEVAELKDDEIFADLGVDSLLSLVLAEKMSSELRIEVKSAIFLECETVGDVKTWIVENS